ncbi:bifunctional diaminohydroxyphosphoribosylaminopyrimidine deaminase/5-amino-6-(5-phosphoribosylamino)uracil reductase RibD [Lutibacter sp.]|uniref:bifunctional diaminohydroxyphosphoribosylaminopyrimidine deaminase/5-amino-6-(5-phosphoribosylamino)uracil reductase RibD n=1 Tax=Lutibacter sp. TaxID=1925666 RepID=UPI002735D31C|nr:bifunctional diaminohydroxyphosphoribosylaminopyrimidine deaminase/5-amino-6-(5-phosphoribosylamino)uracil reductase RibD [Lutibacter sp.]MDP3314201.1 bifunctional diaminohydroxyphosphoribosylaminopyrimidine deaminase/5-amino-6-(5-phosphoribosylamino)uracil reductase RibD [Lutibacter sp.]
MNIHEKYINRCIHIAKNGIGNTYPNPLVGSVIVLNNKIIGEGWHQKSGGHHAEVEAINDVSDKNLLRKATIYVNLEPCSHFGKTPPCANLIIEKGIKKVVIGSLDPNPKVGGKGVKYLQDNGCEVVVGVLEKECLELNKRFFTVHIKNRPFVILKWGETKNGFIDEIRNEKSLKEPNWISNVYSQQRVHKMRAEEQAILIGTNTALNDNPSLTVRSWFGKNPIRIVLDRQLKIPSHYELYSGLVKTIFLTEKTPSFKLNENVFFEELDFKSNVPQQICAILLKHEIHSVIIEGGAKTLQTFINENCWDEAYKFVGNMVFEGGVKGPVLNIMPTKIEQISDDILNCYVNY